MDWREQAACKGLPTSWWFPDMEDPDDIDDGTIGPTEHLYEQGRKICATCPVQSECLAEAIENKEQYGMWGASAPIGRLRIARKRRRRRMIDRRLAEAEALLEENDYDAN